MVDTICEEHRCWHRPALVGTAALAPRGARLAGRDRDPVPWLLDAGEPAARWATLTAVCDREPGDPAVQAARRDVLADPATTELVARLPDWTAGDRLSGHNTPSFAPNLLNLLADMGVAAGDFDEIERLLDAMLAHQEPSGRFPSYAPVRGTEDPVWGALLCDSHAVVEVLVRFGRQHDPRVTAGLERMAADLTGTAQGRAWPCLPHSASGWRGPARWSLTPVISCATRTSTITRPRYRHPLRAAIHPAAAATTRRRRSSTSTPAAAQEHGIAILPGEEPTVADRYGRDDGWGGAASVRPVGDRAFWPLPAPEPGHDASTPRSWCCAEVLHRRTRVARGRAFAGCRCSFSGGGLRARGDGRGRYHSPREPWRKTGIARTIHDELLNHRGEERAALLVERAHPRVRALYEHWGYQWFGEILPFPDAPLYDAMIKPLR
jgi:hypothetical protein